MLKVQTKATKRARSERRTGTTADIHLQSHPSAGTGRKRKQLVQAKTKTRMDKLASPQRGLLCRLLLNKWIKASLQQCLLIEERRTQVMSVHGDSSGTRGTQTHAATTRSITRRPGRPFPTSMILQKSAPEDQAVPAVAHSDLL